MGPNLVSSACALVLCVFCSALKEPGDPLLHGACPCVSLEMRELTVVLDVAIRSARPAAPPAAGPRRRGVYTI